MELIPDGTVEVRKSNKQNFEYKMSINDKMYYSYHRNNGITKIGIVDKSEKSTNTLFSDEGFTQIFLRISTGAMILQDRMNQAYIREIYPDTIVISGL